MSADSVQDVLRLAAGALLIGVLLVVLAALWRDARLSAELMNASRRPYGKLAAVETIGTTSVLTGESYPLLALTTIGRSPASTIRVDDTFVSNQHAVVMLRDGQWWLEDHHSRNGTLLNDQPVLQPVVVTSGDIIGIGQKRFRLELEA